MAKFDLICNECRHHYRVEAEHAWMDEHKQCPECGTQAVHQTIRSYLRNGPIFTEEMMRNLRNKSSCCCCASYANTDDERPKCG